jgi:hypothetical protein
MMTIVRLAVALCGVAALSGCQKSLPTAPSELTAGIVIYQHDDYLGKSAHVVSNQSNLKDVSGPCVEHRSNASGSDDFYSWDDCISSVRVAPGWRATFFGDNDYKGMRLEVGEDFLNLRFVPGGDFNDGVSSIRVFPPSGGIRHYLRSSLPVQDEPSCGLS